MSSNEELPISNLEDGNPIVDEVDEVEVNEVDMDISSELSSDNGGYNELPLMDDNTKPDDLGRPGHMFPLIAKEGGVLQRAGHTEAAMELSEL